MKRKVREGKVMMLEMSSSPIKDAREKVLGKREK